MAKERTGLIGALAQRFSLQRPPMGMTPRGMDLWMEREVRRLLSEGKCRWTLIARANQPYRSGDGVEGAIVPRIFNAGVHEPLTHKAFKLLCQQHYL